MSIHFCESFTIIQLPYPLSIIYYPLSICPSITKTLYQYNCRTTLALPVPKVMFRDLLLLPPMQPISDHLATTTPHLATVPTVDPTRTRLCQMAPATSNTITIQIPKAMEQHRHPNHQLVDSTTPREPPTGQPQADTINTNNNNSRKTINIINNHNNNLKCQDWDTNSLTITVAPADPDPVFRLPRPPLLTVTPPKVRAPGTLQVETVMAILAVTHEFKVLDLTMTLGTLDLTAAIPDTVQDLTGKAGQVTVTVLDSPTRVSIHTI